MYASFLPSAHSFISSVEEKVKVEERIISVTMGPLTPRRLGSSPLMAFVWGPNFASLLVFIVESVHRVGEQKQPPNWQGHRQFGRAGVPQRRNRKRAAPWFLQ